MVITHAIIEKLHFLVSGMPYNVRLVRSVDGGKTFWYCGFGCFCKTKEEGDNVCSVSVLLPFWLVLHWQL